MVSRKSSGLKGEKSRQHRLQRILKKRSENIRRDRRPRRDSVVKGYQAALEQSETILESLEEKSKRSNEARQQRKEIAKVSKASLQQTNISPLSPQKSSVSVNKSNTQDQLEKIRSKRGRRRRKKAAKHSEGSLEQLKTNLPLSASSSVFLATSNIKNRSEKTRNDGRPSRQKVIKPTQIPLEQTHKSFSSPPNGYVFVTKGNVYITRHCRAMTRAQGKILYVVQKHDRPFGLHVPIEVYESVKANAEATMDSRIAAVQRVDAASLSKATKNLTECYPNIPPADADKVLAHAFKKGSGRVGRTTRLDDASVAKLAVDAYIRHAHTPYDKLLESKSRNAAREEVSHQARKLEQRWAGKNPGVQNVPARCGSNK